MCSYSSIPLIQYLVEAERVSSHRVLLVAAADTSEGLQPPIRRCFSHEISMSSLSEAQRINMLSQSLQGATKIHDQLSNFLVHSTFNGSGISEMIFFFLQSINDEFLKDIIAQTSGFMPRDIRALVADASASFVHRFLADNDRVGLSEHDENSVAGFKSAWDGNSSDRNAAKHLGGEDLSKALERSKKRSASALGTPKVRPQFQAKDIEYHFLARVCYAKF